MRPFILSKAVAALGILSPRFRYCGQNIRDNKILCLGLLLVLGSSLFTACTDVVDEKTTTPERESNRDALGGISGSFRIQGDTYYPVRVFAHEVNTSQISQVQTEEGDTSYTIPNLPAGSYWVVGWFYPSGVSGAYTSLDTVMAVGADQAQACKDAIQIIVLNPGDHFTGADIGCWGGNFFDIAQPGGHTRLDPNRWKLTKMDGQSLIPETGITLVFDNGTFFGSAGCNNYGGKYATAPGGGFVLNEIAKNEMLCLEPAGVMEQEDQYLAALTSTRRFITLNKVLELVNEDGKTLLKFDLVPKFTEVKPDDLVGKTWRLVSAPGLEGEDLQKFSISFDGQGFSGTTTCRDYIGTYTAENDRLNINYLEMTIEVNCEEGMLMAEGWYTTLLERIEQYNVLETQLELYTLDRDQLIFEIGLDQVDK